MKEYQFIFIDADDTLFDYKAAEKHALSQSLHKYDVTFDERILSDYS